MGLNILLKSVPKPVKTAIYDLKVLVAGRSLGAFCIRVILAVLFLISAIVNLHANTLSDSPATVEGSDVESFVDSYSGGIDGPLDEGVGDGSNGEVDHTWLSDILANVRCSHLRAAPLAGGVGVDTTAGCTAGLWDGTRHLVICDSSSSALSHGDALTSVYDACEMAARTGLPVLAVTPHLLHRQLHRMLQLIKRMRSLRVLTLVGAVRAFEMYGLPAHIAYHLPAGAILKGVDTTGPATVLASAGRGRGSRAHFSYVTRVRRGYESTAHGMPVLTGPASALAQFSHYARTGRRHVAIAVTGDTHGEMASAADMQRELQAALGELTTVHLVRTAKPGVALHARSEEEDGLPGFQRAADQPSVHALVNLTDHAGSARLLGRYDAIVCLEGWTASNSAGRGTYDAHLIQTALSSGARVLVPASSLTEEMAEVGVESFPDGEAVHVLLTSLTPSGGDASGGESALRARARAGAYAAWHSKAVGMWRTYLTTGSEKSAPDKISTAGDHENIAPAALDNVQAGATVQQWGPNLTALGLPAPAARPSRATAFLARELFPLPNGLGGPGTVTSLLAVELLASGRPVVMIGDTGPQCEDVLNQWRFYAMEAAGLNPEETAVLLRVHCAHDVATSLVKAHPALSGLLGGKIQASGDVGAAHGVYRESHFAHLMKLALVVRHVYERSPFAVLEVPDTDGLAFELLRPRLMRLPAAAHYIPPSVRVQVRAHGTRDAASEFNHGALGAEVAHAEPAARRGLAGRHGDVHRRVRARLLTERLAIQAADAVVVPTEAAGEAYQRAYGLLPSSIVLGLPPMSRLLARDWPKPVTPADEMDEDTEEECSDELMAFAQPCARRSDPACAYFVAYGKVDAVKGADVIARAAAAFSHPVATQIQVVFAGPDGLCGPDDAGAAAALAARKAGTGGVGFPVRGPLLARECVRASLPPAARTRIHFESRATSRCIGPVIRHTRPVAAVFGSRTETFHLAAHELARTGIPLVLPDLPVYRGYFTHAPSSREPVTGVHFYASGNVTALTSVLLALATARVDVQAGGAPGSADAEQERDALDLPGVDYRALEAQYGEPLAPYTAALEGAEAQHALGGSRDSEGSGNDEPAFLTELGSLVSAIEAVRTPPCTGR